MTPVKYECDIQLLTCVFTMMKHLESNGIEEIGLVTLVCWNNTSVVFVIVILVYSVFCLIQWLGAIRQQAIAWAKFDPDLWYRLMSPSHDELILSYFCSWTTQCELRNFECYYQENLFAMPVFKAMFVQGLIVLTHWGRVMHVCISKLTIIGSDNGLSPQRRQTIIWTNGRILFIRP